MATYVLTYNPAKWNWDAADRQRSVKRTASGKTTTGSWSTGSRRSGIEPGDDAVLLQQGASNRGLIARGRFTSAVYQDKHWDGTGRDANYADVEWDIMLPDDDLIPVDEVAAKVTTVNWNYIQGSGIVVPSPGDVALAKLWGSASQTVKSPAGKNTTPKPKQKSQGWQDDPVRRRQVEDHAQAMLEAEYRTKGWKVEDTRRGNPFDARGTKKGKTLYLEAKGTETDGESVLVTKGEVEWAKKHPGECVLGIVSGITFDASGLLDTSSGELNVHDWDPATGVLAPQVYRWTPQLT